MCGLGQISLSFGFSPNILSMIVWETILTDFWSIFNHFTKKAMFSQKHTKICIISWNFANLTKIWQISDKKKFSDNHGQNILAKSHKLSKFSKACFLIPPYAKFSPGNDKISMKINVLDLFERFSFSFSSFYLIFWPN